MSGYSLYETCALGAAVCNTVFGRAGGRARVVSCMRYCEFSRSRAIQPNEKTVYTLI